MRGSRGSRVRSLFLRGLLDLAYHAATPLVLPAFLPPSPLSRRRYRAGFAERLGAAPRREGDRPCLWLHAVSVGELRAALPLIEGLRAQMPSWDLRVSTGTDAAQELAAKLLPPAVGRFYFPLDYGWAVRRALRRVRPRAVVLIELELWPNFLLAAEEARVPVLVASGRVSDRSFPRYRRLGPLARAFFGRLSAVGAQTDEYASRFLALGAPAGRVEVLGNLKYDAAPSADPAGGTAGLLGWEGDSRVLLAASTHPGEEEAVLRCFGKLKASAPGLRLAVAPRHIERSAEVEAVLAASGEEVMRWSALRDGGGGSAPRRGGSILLIDVLGELDRFYRLADLVFVGGSLVPRGGHNLLEPARFGKPVLFGPSDRNFAELARHLLEARAALKVDGEEGLLREAARLLADPPAREELGRRAREAAGRLGGAVEKHLSWLRRVLDGRPAQ